MKKFLLPHGGKAIAKVLIHFMDEILCPYPRHFASLGKVSNLALSQNTTLRFISLEEIDRKQGMVFASKDF